MFKILFCLFISVAWAQANYELVPPPKEMVTLLLGVGQTCTTESGAEADIIQKLMTGTYSNDLNTKKFMTCFLEKGNFGDGEGYLIKANVLPVFGPHKKAKKLGRVIEQCNEDARKVKYDNKGDLAFGLMNCLHKNSPLKPKLD